MLKCACIGPLERKLRISLHINLLCMLKYDRECGHTGGTSVVAGGITKDCCWSEEA